MSESITSLRLKVDSTDIKNAEKDLNNLTKASGNTDKSATNLTKSFTLMGGAISAVAAIALAKQFTESADSMNRLDGRLKLATSSAKEFIDQQAILLNISKETYTPLKNITDLYVKLSPSLQKLGADTDAVNQVTSNFAKGLKLGGAGINETASAVLQFGQAMASGVLRGDEFNSMAEASPKLMEYMAKGMGVPMGAMREMAANGELTAGRVSAALLKMSSEIDKDFKTLPKTVGDSLVNFNTELDKAIQRLDKTMGATTILSGAITDMATVISNKNGEMDKLVTTTTHLGEVLGVLALAYGTYITVQKASLGYLALSTTTTIAYNIATNLSTPAVTRLTVAQVAATVATRAWTAALNLNPLVLSATVIAAGIYGVVQAMDAFSDAQDRNAKNSKSYADKQDKYFKSFRYTIDEIKKPLSELEKQEKGYLSGVDAARKSGNKSAEKVYQDNVNRIQKEKKVYLDAIKEQENAANKKAGIKKVGKTQAEIIADLEKDMPKEKAKKEKKAVKSDEQKEAERLAKEIAEQERKIDHALNQSKLDNISKITLARQESETDVENASIQADTDNQIRKQLIIDGWKTELEKLNESVLDEYDFISKMFPEGIPQTWFDNVNNRFKDLKETVSEMDFSNSIEFDPQGLEGTAKAIAGIGKATDKLAKAEVQYNKNKSIFGATKEELAKNEEEHTKDQIAGYANLAGSMSNFFEEGTAGAQAFQTVQSGLAVVNAVTGIAAQAALPFPYNIAAMAGTAATVFSFLSSAGITGGGGGGGGASAPTENFEQNRTNIENTYTPMTDRLDRQIDLLEAIERNGSASAISASNAKLTFDRDYQLFVNQSLTELHDFMLSSWGVDQNGSTGRKAMEASVESDLGFNAFTNTSRGTIVNKDLFKVGMNFMQFVETFNKDFVKNSDFLVLLDRNWGEAGSPLNMATARLTEFTNEFQSLLGDFTLSILDSVSELNGASDTFKDAFDDITGTARYENARLIQAQQEVTSLANGMGVADYLESQINNIALINETLSSENIATLLSQDPTKLSEQLDIINALEERTGMVFDEGARSALDFMDSIELVTESMASSRENIDTWSQRNETLTETTNRLITSAGLLNDLNTTSLEAMNASIATIYDRTIADGLLNDAELGALQSSEDLRDELFKVETTISNVADEAKALADQTKTLQDRYSSLGATTEQIRDKERLTVDSTNLALLNSIFAREDELQAITATEAIQKRITEFNMTAREKELAIASATDGILLNQLYTLEDAKEAADELANKNKQIADERIGLESTLFNLTHDVNAQRAKELLTLDVTNRSLQSAIWAEEDRQDAIEESNNRLEETNNMMTSVFSSIIDFVKELRGETDLKNVQGSFNGFISAFNAMQESIINKAENAEDMTSSAIESARGYLDSVTATAESSRDVAFANALVASKFAGVNTGSLTSNAIVPTPYMSVSEANTSNAELLNELRLLRQLNTSLVADSGKQLAAQRALVAQSYAV